MVASMRNVSPHMKNHTFPQPRPDNMASSTVASKETWQAIAKDVTNLVNEKNCHPILVRLAWHDAGTYDVATQTGGPRASMRFAAEAAHGANNGLGIARNLLAPLKEKYPEVSTADFWQFAAYVAIHAAGGPKIPFSAGRPDANESEPPIPSGRLPDATQGADHLRWVFTTKMNLNDQEIVALSGAHALGRCHPDRSGFDGPWTETPNTFGNTYFAMLTQRHWQVKEGSKPMQYEDQETKKLMMLPTDMVLLEDKSFAEHVNRYAQNQELFFSEFSSAFKKLSELGHSNLTPVEY